MNHQEQDRHNEQAEMSFEQIYVQAISESDSEEQFPEFDDAAR